MIVSVELERVVTKRIWANIEVDDDLVDWEQEAIDKALEQTTMVPDELMTEDDIVSPWEVIRVVGKEHFQNAIPSDVAARDVL